MICRIGQVDSNMQRAKKSQDIYEKKKKQNKEDRFAVPATTTNYGAK